MLSSFPCSSLPRWCPVVEIRGAIPVVTPAKRAEIAIHPDAEGASPDFAFVTVRVVDTVTAAGVAVTLETVGLRPTRVAGVEGAHRCVASVAGATVTVMRAIG